MNGNFWRFEGAPGYDFAVEMAKLGHVSIVIDRLGYGGSGTSDGGAHAARLSGRRAAKKAGACAPALLDSSGGD